jgi:hypothetical protein
MQEANKSVKASFTDFTIGFNDRLILLKITWLFLLIPVLGAVNAQKAASPYWDAPSLTPFVNYAIQSGRMHMPFVLNQPYTAAKILQSTAAQKIYRPGS